MAAPTSDALLPPRMSPSSWALLFDIDGTLAPIAMRPEQAEVPADTRELLARLAKRYALVGCISGRASLDARELVGLPQLHYVGNHGYELLVPGAEEPEVDDAVAATAGAAARFVAELDHDRLAQTGIRVEDKDLIQALHWRGAPDEERAASLAEEIAADAALIGLSPRAGRMVMELRPDGGIDKGSGVFTMLEHAHPARNALYAGDDLTDLDAFRALGNLKRLGRLDSFVRVGVRSEEGPDEIAAQADLVVGGVAGMISVLAELAG